MQYNHYLKQPARQLRSQQTEAEQMLWQRLRRKQIHDVQFYRQRPIDQFIVDFYCHAAMLVIECDGSQHYSAEGLAQDLARDDRLRSLGLQVLRFDNRQILAELNAVCEVITQIVFERTKASKNPPNPL